MTTQHRPTIDGFRKILFNIWGFHNNFPYCRLTENEGQLLTSMMYSTNHVDMSTWLDISDTVVEGVHMPLWHPYGYRMMASAREALKSYKGQDSWFFSYMKSQIAQLDAWHFLASFIFQLTV